MEISLPTAIAALWGAGAALTASLVLGGRELVLWLSGRRWDRWAAFHRKALAGLREDLAALYRSTHYRHNIHCPQCGRLSRQAEGYPEGIGFCKTHGLGMVVVEPTTGTIPVVVVELPAGVGKMFPETPPLELMTPEPDFTELETGPLPIIEEMA